jgi:ABC-type multidrug transport system permease subunit
MWRQFLLVSRDKVFLRSRAAQSVFMGLLAGSLFFDLEYDSVQNIFGLMQYAAMFLALSSMPQLMVRVRSSSAGVLESFHSPWCLVCFVIQIAFAQRPVLYKHADASLFPSSTFVISQTLVQLPISVLDVLLFGSIGYFMAGLANSAARFFTFALVIFVFQLAFGQLFRTLAAILPSVQVVCSTRSVRSVAWQEAEHVIAFLLVNRANRCAVCWCCCSRCLAAS